MNVNEGKNKEHYVSLDALFKNFLLNSRTTFTIWSPKLAICSILRRFLLIDTSEGSFFSRRVSREVHYGYFCFQHEILIRSPRAGDLIRIMAHLATFLVFDPHYFALNRNHRSLSSPSLFGTSPKPY